MVEQFSEKERKLLKHVINIYENELRNELNSLMTIYEDYGRPEKKSPYQVFIIPTLTDSVLVLLPVNLQKKIDILHKQDMMVYTTMAMKYLEIMDTETFSNPDMWIRFKEIQNVKRFSYELHCEEYKDNPDEYDELQF